MGDAVGSGDDVGEGEGACAGSAASKRSCEGSATFVSTVDALNCGSLPVAALAVIAAFIA
jgi:hypothetical protein